ncbi:interferon-induced, double-stranded RNA-activated protein kinase [Saccopteryx bilineata]|uniref:interferon-induced, double-stranded RNA-activated protein kinase n=1 Tax=Saccopteryx bilineata TaxID=59482 RepID=UPI00338D5A23
MASDLSSGFYIDAINKYRQKNNVKVDYRELCKTGPPHDLRFTFQVIIDGREYPKAEGKSKRDARNAAAKIAIDILNKEKQEVSDLSQLTTDTADDLSSGNYVGLVNSYTQKAKLPVNYQECELDTNGTRRFHCVCIIGKKEYGNAVGSTKKNARQSAAKITYEQLQLEKEAMKDVPGPLGSSTAGSSDYGSNSSMITSDSESPSENGLSANESERKNSDSSIIFCSSAASSPRNNSGKVKINLAAKFDSPGVVGNKHTSNPRFVEDFSEIRPIGSGAYGHVFKAKQNVIGKTFVIKRVKYDKKNEEKVLREASVLTDLFHDNIVRYYHSWSGIDDIYDESGKKRSIECLFIQMEFCDKGTLEQWIDNRRDKEPNKCLSLELFKQIVVGVNYLHSKNLIHRDLKPSNIFLVNNNKIKIGDFGLVTFQKYDEKRTSNRGTPLYMSPEQVSSTDYGNEVDIFALGLILAELLYICPTRSEMRKIFEDLKKGCVPDIFDGKEKSLLQKLLSVDPKKRPTACEILTTLTEWKNVAENKMRNTNTAPF